MSSVLRRGPVCGINNCRSRLWRTINGQKVCQHGHIREGEIEIDEEDGEPFVQTRRLNLPTLSQSQAQSLREVKQQRREEGEKLFGAAAKGLFLRCFQVVLRSQVRWLVEHKKVPAELEAVVRELWIVYLETVCQEDRLNASSSGYRAVGSSSSGEADTDTTIYTDGEARPSEGELEFSSAQPKEDLLLQNEGAPRDNSAVPRKRRKLSKVKKHSPNHVPLIHSIVLCYLGCVVLRVPVHSNDFVRLCSVNKIPYMNALAGLPKSMRQKLPNYYYLVFEPAHPPVNGDFYRAVKFVTQKLELFNWTEDSGSGLLRIKESALADMQINHQVLLMKVLKELVLPKELYHMVGAFVDIHNVDFKFDGATGFLRNVSRHMKNPGALLWFPEIRLVCIVISMTKLYFISQNVFAGQEQHAGQRVFDWKVWLDLIHEKKFSFSGKEADGENFDSLLSYLTANGHAKEEFDLLSAAFQDDINFAAAPPSAVSRQLDRYLQWFDKTIIKTDTRAVDSHLTIADKRLLDLFSIDGEETNVDQETSVDKETSVANDDREKSAKSAGASQPQSKAAQNEKLSRALADQSFKRVNDVGRILFEDVLKIEKVLVNELSINFGVRASDLKFWVLNWSDQMLFKLL